MYGDLLMHHFLRGQLLLAVLLHLECCVVHNNCWSRGWCLSIILKTRCRCAEHYSAVLFYLVAVARVNHNTKKQADFAFLGSMAREQQWLAGLSYMRLMH
jgi:hypothetical protein